MERTKSLLLRSAVFAVACAALLAVVVLRDEGSKTSDDAAGMGPAFAPVKAEKVQTLEFEQTTRLDGKPVKSLVRLVRTGPAAWKLASSFDHPADTGRVEGFLKGLSGAKRHAEPTSNPAKFPSFAGPDGFLDVRVFDTEAGAPALSFGIGKSNAEGGYSAKKFVRVDDAAGGKSARILVVSDLASDGSLTSPTNWVETRLLPTLTNTEVAEFTIEVGEAHRPVTFVRGKKKDEKDADDPWEMTAPDKQPALAEPVMALVRGFVGMTFASIEAGKIAPGDEAKYGFDKPDVILRGTGRRPEDGSPAPTWTIRVGSKVEGRSTWYARRATGEAADPFVFTVNDYDVTDFKKDPATWVEKKPEPPAPEAAPAMGDVAPPTPDAAPGMGDAPPPPPPTPPAEPATPPVAPAPPPSAEPPSVPPAPAMDAPPTPAPSPQAPPTR